VPIGPLKTGEEFNSNYCPIVVDALAERLRVTGFDCGDDEELAEQLWDWWVANRGDALQGIAHTAAGRDGDTYVLVDWNEDDAIPRLRHQAAYDGTEGIKVHYNRETREIAFASKRWRIESENPGQAGKVRRLNLYYPNRIEKYISNQDAFEGAWLKYAESESAWPIPWENKAGEPLGVPIIHFKNGADANGLSLAPGSWVAVEDAGVDSPVSIGQLEAADLTGVIELKDSFVTEIARVSRTPLSYFQSSGQRPAEGTLKQEEVGLVARAEDRQVGFGNAWEDCLRLGIRLYNTFGEGGLDEDATISTQWDDPQTRNEKEHLETLTMKAKLDVPHETLWAEMGYDADQIAEMKAQRGEEMEEQSNIGGELLRAFEGGGFGGQIEQNEQRRQERGAESK